MHVPIPSAPLREAVARQTVRFRTSRLRRITAPPFGLTAAAGPVMLGDESSSTGLVEEIKAAVTHASVQLDSISLIYGDCLDLSAPLVEVITHWDTGRRPAGGLLPYARELGAAAQRDELLARGDWTLDTPDPEPATGPFDSGSVDMVVSGTRTRAGTVLYRNFTAFSFPVPGAEVAVVSRRLLPQLPHFDPVTDLQPFCSGWASFMEDMSERLYGPPRPSLT